MAVATAKVSAAKVSATKVATAKVAKVAISPAKVAIVADQVVEAGRQLALRRQVGRVGGVGTSLKKICHDWNTETSTMRICSWSLNE